MPCPCANGLPLGLADDGDARGGAGRGAGGGARGHRGRAGVRGARGGGGPHPEHAAEEEAEVGVGLGVEVQADHPGVRLVVGAIGLPAQPPRVGRAPGCQGRSCPGVEASRAPRPPPGGGVLEEAAPQNPQHDDWTLP